MTPNLREYHQLVRALAKQERHRLVRDTLVLPKECGVYLITNRQRQHLYLGRTANIRRRLKQQLLYEGGRHTLKKKLKKEKGQSEAVVIKWLSKCYVQFLPCQESMVKRLEHLAIAVLDPSYND